MTRLIIFVITICTFIGCNSTEKRFFDYDEIEYYFNNYDEAKLSDLYENQSKSEIDSFKMGVILQDIPKDIADLSFIGKLEEMGYHKSYIDKSKFADIDKLFAEKKISDNEAASCIYVYRDILIFKKQNKIVGTAKICFGCNANQIRGASAHTENFGQNGDYEKLAKLLRQ